MPNRKYQNGTAFERAIKADLTEDGYFTMKAGGSKGPADLVAVKRRHVLLVQCKINGVVLPAARNELWELARRIEALPIIAYRPSPKKRAFRLLIHPLPRGGTYVEWTPDEIADDALPDRIIVERAALVDVAEDVKDMLTYVPEYFRQKRDHDAALRTIRAILGESS